MANRQTQGLTVEQLVALAQATGDRHAFDHLFSLHDARLRAFLRGKAGAADADDLLQETYVKAFLKIRQFNGSAQFSTWLFSIAIYEFLTAKRKQKLLSRIKAMLWHDDQLAQESAHLAPLIDLDRSFQLLNSNQYNAYVLSKAFGYSHAEIADELNLPLGSVKTYINQAAKLINQ